MNAWYIRAHKWYEETWTDVDLPYRESQGQTLCKEGMAFSAGTSPSAVTVLRFFIDAWIGSESANAASQTVVSTVKDGLRNGHPLLCSWFMIKQPYFESKVDLDNTMVLDEKQRIQGDTDLKSLDDDPLKKAKYRADLLFWSNHRKQVQTIIGVCMDRVRLHMHSESALSTYVKLAATQALLNPMRQIDANPDRVDLRLAPFIRFKSQSWSTGADDIRLAMFASCVIPFLLSESLPPIRHLRQLETLDDTEDVSGAMLSRSCPVVDTVRVNDWVRVNECGIESRHMWMYVHARQLEINLDCIPVNAKFQASFADHAIGWPYIDISTETDITHWMSPDIVGQQLRFLLHRKIADKCEGLSFRGLHHTHVPIGFPDELCLVYHSLISLELSISDWSAIPLSGFPPSLVSLTLGRPFQLDDAFSPESPDGFDRFLRWLGNSKQCRELENLKLNPLGALDDGIDTLPHLLCGMRHDDGLRFIHVIAHHHTLKTIGICGGGCLPFEDYTTPWTNVFTRFFMETRVPCDIVSNRVQSWQSIRAQNIVITWTDLYEADLGDVSVEEFQQNHASIRTRSLNLFHDLLDHNCKHLQSITLSTSEFVNYSSESVCSSESRLKSRPPEIIADRMSWVNAIHLERAIVYDTDSHTATDAMLKQMTNRRTMRFVIGLLLLVNCVESLEAFFGRGIRELLQSIAIMTDCEQPLAARILLCVRRHLARKSTQ